MQLAELEVILGEGPCRDAAASGARTVAPCRRYEPNVTPNAVAMAVAEPVTWT